MNIKKIMALVMALVCIMQVNTFAEDGEAVLTQKELVKISTEAELRDFAAKVNAGDDFSDKYVRLENDITLDSSVNWTPIGNTDATPFCGIFYGGITQYQILLKMMKAFCFTGCLVMLKTAAYKMLN